MTGVLIAVIAALVIGTLAALRWRYAIVTVRGVSMEPALRDGDRVLVRRCGAGGCGPARSWCSGNPILTAGRGVSRPA